MFKKFVSSIFALALLVGCSSKSTAAAATEFSVKDAAKSMVETLKITDKMAEVTSDRQVMGLFFFKDNVVSESSVYLPNDSSADIIGVFKTTDIASCEDSINTYLKTLKAQNQTYSPDEVFKIDNALVKDNGDSIVILAVCKDIETAKKKAEELLNTK